MKRYDDYEALKRAYGPRSRWEPRPIDIYPLIHREPLPKVHILPDEEEQDYRDAQAEQQGGDLQ